MPVCVRCRKETGVLGGLLGFNKQTGRCSSCESQVKQSLNHFRHAFIHFSQDDVLSPQEWQQLQSLTLQGGVDWNEALQYVRGDALHFLERVLAFAAADGVITDEEERYFDLLPLPGEFTRLKIPPFGGLDSTAIVARMRWVSPARARWVVDTRCTPHAIVRSYVLPLLYSQTRSGSSTLLSASR